jgi:hypothetical protein
MTTKAQLKERVLKDSKIRVESATTVNGAVAFLVDYGRVRCIGWATEVERNIHTIDDLVDYLYVNRARIIKE